MPRATVATTNPDSIEIEYETFGSPDDPTLLLVMGFTAQSIAWDDELCRELAGRGSHVIRFDNRDCGLSTHLDGVKVNPMAVLQAKLAAQRGSRRSRTPSRTWATTPSACSTPSASTRPT